MNFLPNRRLATRIGIITTIITFLGMLLLWRIVSGRVAAIVESDITNQMTDAVEARASIINDYVASAEEYMTAFALSGEVRELLANPDDPALLQKAQEYTEVFASVKGTFEELYIATPATYVLTHTSRGAIGMTTRSGESLEEFQNTILAQSQLTNLTLAISAMQVISECIQSIKTLMDEIAYASVQQSEMITSVEKRVKEVSKVTQSNSNAAGQGAAISNRLSDQSKTLNHLIGQFRIQ